MPLPESVDCLEDGYAHSPRFQDRCHSCSGGLAQATWAAWLADPQRSPHHSFTSVEAWPVAAADPLRAARAACFPL